MVEVPDGRVAGVLLERHREADRDTRTKRNETKRIKTTRQTQIDSQSDGGEEAGRNTGGKR